jgi:hypothetical protein
MIINLCWLFLFALTFNIPGYAQIALREPYDFEGSKKILVREFNRGNIWLMLTDTNNVCFFQSKADARKNARIETLPVLKLHRSDSHFVPEPDYTVSIGLLYKSDSLIGTIAAWQGPLSMEMALMENPPLELLSSTGQLAYYRPGNEFISCSGGKIKAWDDIKQQLVDFDPKGRGNPDLTSIKANGTEDLASGKSSLTSQSYFLEKTLGGGYSFFGERDSIMISPEEKIPDTEFNKVWISFGNENLYLKYQGFFWLYDVNDNLLLTFTDEGGILEESGDSTFRFKIQTKKTAFILSLERSSKELVKGKLINEGARKALRLEVDTTAPELLKLTTVLLCWEHLKGKNN